jgi:hypothetical protein
MIDRLHRLEGLTTLSAPKVAVAVEAEVRDQISQGVGPDGVPWKKTKEGKTPLQNAASALTVRPIGSVVLLRLTGPEAKHHLGAVKGKIKRPIIPTGKIPDPMTRAIERVVTGEFRRITEGR